MKALITFVFILVFPFIISSQPTIKDTIVFGSDKLYPPYEYLNKKGEPEGFNIDLIREVAKEMGVVVKTKLGTWEQIRIELEVDGTVDISDMFYSEAHDSVVDYAFPHEILFDEIYLHKESKPISKIEDLIGKKVAIQKASTTEEYIRFNFPGVDIITTETEFDALQLVSEKKMQCSHSCSNYRKRSH